MMWEKYLTREYSFLFMTYAAEVYRRSLRQFFIFHGKGKVVSAYGTPEDTEKCYKKMNKEVVSSLKRTTLMLHDYPPLVQKIKRLCKAIQQESDKKKVPALFHQFHQLFQIALEHYLFLVYAGYAAHQPDIKKFIEEHQEQFNTARNLPLDTDIEEQFPRMMECINPAWKECSNILSYQEILAFLAGQSIDLSKVKARKKEYLLVTKEGKTQEYFGEDITAVMSQEIQGNDYSEHELRGQTACPGKVQGTARVVLIKDDYKKIKEGDILVTPMTKPNIVIYLHKVKGIVTDDGGTLSHASIISREMNIPCIVGTKYATETIKDGDILLVDADQGFVKKKPSKSLKEKRS